MVGCDPGIGASIGMNLFAHFRCHTGHTVTQTQLKLPRKVQEATPLPSPPPPQPEGVSQVSGVMLGVARSQPAERGVSRWLASSLTPPSLTFLSHSQLIWNSKLEVFLE